MKNLLSIEDIEFVAECSETAEKVSFTMADLYGWDDETVYLDTSIYLNRPKHTNWAIVYNTAFSRILNPEYNIHLRTEEDGVLKEPLKLLSIKQYSRYRFEAKFSNHVVRTGRFDPTVYYSQKEPLFHEDEFECAKQYSRRIQVRKDVSISAMDLWKISDEYIHYGCLAENYKTDKFEKIKNIPFSTKPSGGFWASPRNRRGKRCYLDWETFCKRDNFHPSTKLNFKFLFCLDVNARIARIETPDDFNLLPKIDISNEAPVSPKTEFIDFEECIRQGIDAIEYNYTEAHKNEDSEDEMDRKMLGWDCDSILILNPEIILKESFLTERTTRYIMKAGKY